MVDRLLQWLRDDSGQDLVEYGLLAALISVAAVTVMLSASDQIGQLWGTIRDRLVGLI
jgi:Flp pilus assembly pilin Flp